MSPNAQNIINLINLYVRNYAVESFQNNRLNNILQQMVQFIDGISTGTANIATAIEVFSANFSTGTNCPQASMNGRTFLLFWNDEQKFLTLGTDFQYLAGGGFSILIPGFNSASANFTFVIFPTS